MDLLNSNRRNVNICKKALYAKQLSIYAHLCKKYQQLADLNKGSTPTEIEQKYSYILTQISSGMSVEEAIKNDTILHGQDYETATHGYSKTERDIFKVYAKFSTLYHDYKYASQLLNEATASKGETDPKKDAEFERFMNSSDSRSQSSTRIFLHDIKSHSPTFNAFSAYVTAREAVKSISEIDSSHIDHEKIAASMTPETFGANIRGCRTRLLTNPLRAKDDKIKETEDKFFAIKAENNIQRFCTKHRTAIRRVFATVLAAGLIFAAGQHINDAHIYNNLNIDTAASQGYEVVLTQDTQSEIQRVEQLINDAKASPDTPTYEELASIRYGLDEVIDNVMTDLVTDAFEEAHPEYQVLGVETRYDKTVNQGKSPNSEPAKENTVTITYLDENGEQKTENVQNFSATALLNNAIEESFKDEYKLDGLHPSSTPNPDQNFIQNDQEVYDLILEYEEVLGGIKHLSATKLVYKDGNFLVGPSLKSVTPEKIVVEDTQPTIDDGDER